MVKGDTSPLEVFAEPYPCDGCPHYERCGAEELSCEAFYSYVQHKGNLITDPEARTPNMGWYYKTFVRRGKPDATYERILFLESRFGDLNGE